MKKKEKEAGMRSSYWVGQGVLCAVSKSRNHKGKAGGGWAREAGLGWRSFVAGALSLGQVGVQGWLGSDGGLSSRGPCAATWE